MFTMGDVARCSLGGPQDFYNEEMLYRLFGVNAELLIDHALGLGTLHHRGHQSLQAHRQQLRQRPGAALRHARRPGTAHRAGNG